MLGTSKLKLVPLNFYMKYYGKKLLNNEPSGMISIQTKQNVCSQIEGDGQVEEKNISTVINYDDRKDERIVVSIDELLLALTDNNSHINYRDSEGK